jgi:hypothetical protein
MVMKCPRMAGDMLRRNHEEFDMHCLFIVWNQLCFFLFSYIVCFAVSDCCIAEMTALVLRMGMEFERFFTPLVLFFSLIVQIPLICLQYLSFLLHPLFLHQITGSRAWTPFPLFWSDPEGVISISLPSSWLRLNHFFLIIRPAEISVYTSGDDSLCVPRVFDIFL